MLAELPVFYYRDHAVELFNFVEKHYAHLLTEEHHRFLAEFRALSDAAQQLVIRCWTRRVRFIHSNTLFYEEITQEEQHLNLLINDLMKTDFLKPVETSDYYHFVKTLNKPVLQQIALEAGLTLKKSLAKQRVVELIQAHLSDCQASIAYCISDYVQCSRLHVFNYFLFLYFGDFRTRFERFVMRDLGVMRIRKTDEVQARFENPAESLSAFHYAWLNTQLKLATSETLLTLQNDFFAGQVVGPSAADWHQRCALKLGKLWLDRDEPAKAVAVYRKSLLAESLEKYVRNQYKIADKTGREELNKEIQNLLFNKDLSAESIIFLDDFQARKFNKNKISIYTELVRESSETFKIDEVYTGQIEQGVIDELEDQGLVAFHSENHFWRLLFGLVFWDELFGQEAVQYSEFDRLPVVLKENRFYQVAETAINQRLARFLDSHETKLDLLKVSTEHYHRLNGIFKWNQFEINRLLEFVPYLQTEAVANVLRLMTQHYPSMRDGFPDLLILQDDAIRLLEVKGPSDKLRPNQLVTIQYLREAGLTTDIATVEWHTNPEQRYAVVDVETTGGRANYSRVTEIGVAIVQNGEVVDTWETLVNPGCSIPSKITKLTGITNEMVADAPSFAEIADELADKLEDCIFVAHNVNFDYSFIKHEYSRAGTWFRKPKFCTVQHSRKAFPGLDSYSLANLTRYFDIDLKHHHRALCDATATAKILCHIKGW